MDLFSLIACYLLGLGVLIFLLLFGEAAIFVGTPVAGLHWLLFSGICEAFWWLTERIAGRQAKQLLERRWEKCATSANPVLQIFYIALLAVGFYFYSVDIFCFLPQPYAPLWHKYTGTLALVACLVAFYVASVSDPGRITAGNVSAHTALYPYDELTNRRAQQCWTCLWHRPARSKHCPVCDRCIARFDHHCAWINNCVGLLNLRYFLLFLVANIVLCSYGLVLGCTIMHGVLHERGAWRIMVRERTTGRTFLLGSHPRIMLRWMLQHYNVPVAELIFLGVALLLVVSFFAYHVWLISRATTTYETFKWREVGRRLRAEQMAEQVDDQGQHQEQPLQGVGWRSWLAFWQSYPQHGPVVLPRNIYDAGIYASWKDALNPPAWARNRAGVQGKKQS